MSNWLALVPADAVTAASCFVLVLITTGMHFEVLGLLNQLLPRIGMTGRARLVVAMYGLVVSHAAEAAVYALAYSILARHPLLGALGPVGAPSFGKALYFSVETFSSLGYGDIVPSGSLRMMAGVEALNGLLLIGWSASYVHIAMERFWNGGEG